MRKRRASVFGISVSLLLLGHSAAYAGLVVKTHNRAITRNYWIVRDQDLRRQLALTPNATAESVILRYRRFPVNGLALPTKARVGYTVYPECQGRMKPDGVPADGGQGSVWVDC